MRNNIIGTQKTIFSHYTRQCICLPLGFVFLHNKNLDFAICLHIMHVVVVTINWDLKFANWNLPLVFLQRPRGYIFHTWLVHWQEKNWKIINSSLICLQIYFKFFVILKRKPLSLKKTMIWLTFFQQRGRKTLSTCTVRYFNLHIQITYGISIRPIFTLMIKRRIRCIPPP